MKLTTTKLILLLLLTSFLTCQRDYPNQDIVILFNNLAYDNVEIFSRTRYLKDSLRTQTPYVSLVSCGNFAHNNDLAQYSRGEWIVELINNTGYNITSIGHTDFHYGIERLNKLTGKLKSKVISCNLSRTKNGKLVFNPYFINNYGEKKVAFIGLTQPLHKLPHYLFCDKNGETAYTFNNNELIYLLQRSVLHAKSRGADFIIVLSDIYPNNEYPNTNKHNILNIISKTHDIDAFLTTSPSDSILVDQYPNSIGKTTHLLSIGNKAPYIGQLIISTNNNISLLTQHMNNINTSEKIENQLQKLSKLKITEANKYIGYSNIPLKYNYYQTTPSNDSSLIAFISDALRISLQSDIAIIPLNKNVLPFDYFILDTGIIQRNDIHQFCHTQFPIPFVEILGRELINNLNNSINNLNNSINNLNNKEKDSCLLFFSGLKYENKRWLSFQNDWTPLDSNQLYTVTGYFPPSTPQQHPHLPPLFRNLKSLRLYNKDLETVLINYISEQNDSIPARLYAKPTVNSFAIIYLPIR